MRFFWLAPLFFGCQYMSYMLCSILPALFIIQKNKNKNHCLVFPYEFPSYMPILFLDSLVSFSEMVGMLPNLKHALGLVSGIG